jgi:hypothetical protein
MRRRHWLWAILSAIVLEAIVFGFTTVDQPAQSVAGSLALIVALPWVAVGLWLSLTLPRGLPSESLRACGSSMAGADGESVRA